MDLIISKFLPFSKMEAIRTLLFQQQGSSFKVFFTVQKYTNFIINYYYPIKIKKTIKIKFKLLIINYNNFIFLNLLKVSLLKQCYLL